MRLDEALRETGKASRCHVRGAKELVVDRMFVTLIPTDFAIATDWEPYHDPPKEPKIVCVHFCSPDHGPATRLYEHPGPPCPIPNDPPKGKRLREWWLCTPSTDGCETAYNRNPACHGGRHVEVREVSPERDEIVRAAVEWNGGYKPHQYSWEAGRALSAAVEAWERAGRPA